MILHQLEQGLDRLAPETRTAAAIRGSRRVGLIDEQHTVEGGGDNVAHTDRGLTDIAGDQSERSASIM